MSDLRCRQCGGPLEASSHGLCPRCLLAMAVETPELPADDSFGHYEPVAVLGDGGMGVVYLAEQSAPLRRMVALKVLKPGLEATQTAGRFERERQSLAKMDHPNIATIYDAGTSSRGLPYFVMEYVEGSSLTTYCDRARLTLQDRLALFAEACRAVDHAHQRGILHRDLKPGNILVAQKDGRPHVKVIDFGLARLQDWHAFGREQLTGAAQIVGTPEYMSPEQACGPEPAVGRPSDVYSLGMVLYELLAGVSPYESGQWGGRTVADVLHVIRELAPPPMSRRLRHAAERSEEIAGARRTKPAALLRELSGGIEAIVQKAIAKEPGQRYPSAAALAGDIERFLRGETVEAASGRMAAQFLRRIRLHRAALASILAVLVVVSVVAVALLQRPPAPLRVIDVEPYTTAEGRQTMPSFAPDGRSLVYIWDGPGRGNFDLYVAAAPGAEPRRLTTAPENDVSPAWSPDGREIAFLRAIDAESSRLMLLDTASGKERALIALRGWHSPATRNLDWSPDGKWLAVILRKEGRRYGYPHLYSPASGEMRSIMDLADDAEYLQPAFSPDGRRLAFVRDDQTTATLYVQRLTPGGGADGAPGRVCADNLSFFPAFLPSGEILFKSTTQERARIWKLVRPGGEAEPQDQFGEDVRAFSLSRDGGRIAMTRQVRDVELHRYTLQQDGRWAGPSAIAASPFSESLPQFSPDGKQVAFVSTRSGRMQLWASAPNGAGLRQLTFGMNVRRGPHWLPDSRTIRYGVREGSTPKFFLLDTAGGQPRPDDSGRYFYRHSPDGRYVYFGMGFGNRQKLYRAPVNRLGDATAVSPRQSLQVSFDPAADWAYFLSPFKGKWALFRAATGGQREELIREEVHQVYPAAAADGVYYARQLDQLRFGVFHWNASTGKERLLFETSKRPAVQIAVAPDGGEVILDVLKQDDEQIRVATVAR